MANINALINALLRGQSNGSRSRKSNPPRPQRMRPPKTRPTLRPRTVNNPAWGRSLPAAYASHVRPRFNVATRTATGAVVSGCDLVYPLPSMVSVDSDYIFAVIPSNPAYWAGTRIAQFAPAYMNFRPLKMTFSYIPQVAVTQAGTVFMGTLWNGSAPATNLQQTLFTSNGGCLTQCYVPCDTTVTLGTNLQQNLFTLNGDINPDTSPFIFVAGVRGAAVVPGYFYVTYTYEFKNPVGQSWSYGNTGLITVSSLSTIPAFGNRSLILMSSAAGYGPGTVFDVEDTNSVRYRGTAVDLPSTANAIVLYNGQSAKTDGLASSPVITQVAYAGETVPLSAFTQGSGASISVPVGSSCLRVQSGSANFVRNGTTAPLTVTAAADQIYYLFSTTSQTSVQLQNGAGVPLITISDPYDQDGITASVLFSGVISAQM